MPGLRGPLNKGNEHKLDFRAFCVKLFVKRELKNEGLSID